MKLRSYVNIWIFITCLLSYECLALNHNSSYSLFAFLKQNSRSFHTLSLSPLPGKTISLWYGWIGTLTMILTNLYILRKRFNFLPHLGRLPRWLDFHIFCGLLGPTFILFHSNFKVGGLVAVSFWSMVISFSSGIVGRYFYMQLLFQKNELEKAAAFYESTVKKILEFLPPEQMNQILSRTLALAGGGSTEQSVMGAIANSFIGDLRLAFDGTQTIYRLPPEGAAALKGFAKHKRRANYLTQFQEVMGYWHSFHTPFAIFMYLVAVIHILTALLFRVA